MATAEPTLKTAHESTPSRPVDHVQFEKTVDRSDGIIVCFRVGYYAKPGSDVNDAYKRIRKAFEGLTESIALVRAWDGACIIYPPMSRLVNPPITEAMVQSFKEAAAKAYPEMRLADSWVNDNQGQAGYSVLMAPKTSE